MTKRSLILALLSLFWATSAQAGITVNFPTLENSTTDWTTDYVLSSTGENIFAVAEDTVIGTRSASPLPSVNRVTFNIIVEQANHYACYPDVLVYFDSVYVGRVTLDPAYYYTTITGTVSVTPTNTTSHKVQLYMEDTIYTLSCRYSWLEFDNSNSTITMDLVGADQDGDGYYSTAYYGTDCNDSSATTYPGAPETCNNNDDDCDGTKDEGVTTTYYKDADGDGYGVSSSTQQACSKPTGYATVAGDCNDSSASVYPGATEVCNGVDDDCDASIDEGAQNTYFLDNDGDGFGQTGNTTQACSRPTGYGTVGGDCNDTDATVYPSAPELCDGKDNDCDSSVDEGVKTTYYLDNDGDGYGQTASTQQACSKPSGYAAFGGDCNDANASVNPGATEVCDSIDNDCDASIDEGTLNTYYLDSDKDGYGVSTSSTTACSKPTGYSTASGDCNDSDASIYPGAPETCDTKDNDCDGSVDEGVTTTFYKDGDGDGYGLTSTTTSACTKPSGYASVGGDCNDTNAAIYPGAAEVCNGVDDNCDGSKDEGVTTTFYKDGDADGYGQSGSTTTACTKPSGYATVGGDCNDANAAVYPGATEVCNSIDDNCDGNTDEGLYQLWYLDNDKDGYGVGTSTTSACSKPTGYAAVAGDCNDSNAAVYPGAAEQCDGIDNDCDGAKDEDITTKWYLDNDRDGYGIASSSIDDCTPPAGYASVAGDCNDSNSSVYPGATETCNDVDDDCDGTVDEGLKATWYQDNDNDGYGSSTSTQACSRPSGYSGTSGDCNDSNASVYPGATESCNSVDDDCDGSTDEGLLSTFYKDNDGDTYGSTTSTQACSKPSGYSTNNTDCNDNDASVYPGAAELCDAKDNDCDGTTDEDVQSTYYKDGDADGYGVSDSTTLACSKPSGYATVAGDCNDSNAAVNPGATEVCNGVDDNCDGNVDTGLKTTYYQDSDGDGVGQSSSTIDACTKPSGYASVGGDCNDSDNTVYPGAPELCDTKDNDCDSQVDEGVQTTYYQDADGDGYGVEGNTTQACSKPTGYATRAGDCDDAAASVNPGAAEVCNGVDDDCDALVDEELKSTYYQDADSDGFGNASASQQACGAPAGYVSNNTDCNDNDSTVFPGASEICDLKDNDCDGSTDEGVLVTYHQDADNDSYGNALVSTQSCSRPTGYVSDATDCNDNDASVYPGAVEVCDTKDNDCDGSVDEGALTVYFQDSDKDGYGNDEATSASCSVPAGYVSVGGDCDDTNSAVFPGAVEICDSLDNDCDGELDEEVQTTYYADADNDGYGDPATSETACLPSEGYVDNAGDCDDTNAAIHPDASETCGDGIDQDCNSYDLGCETTDADGDGFSPAQGDCNDNDAQMHPGLTETCDGKDNDCSGTIDDIDADGDTYFDAACNGDDCNDADATINPGAEEVCDGEDNDCTGIADDRDVDGDGSTDVACGGDDCDDSNANVSPNAQELCDTIDNDCDGMVDNVDGDGDGYIAASCNGDDCNDFSADVYPGAPELADGLDNDCDGGTDEGTINSDDDLDGYAEVDNDCNDANGDIHPGAEDTPGDGIDSDCDGTDGEATPTTTPGDDDDTTGTPTGDDDSSGTPSGDDDSSGTPAGDDDSTGGTPGDDDDSTGGTPAGDDDSTGDDDDSTGGTPTGDDDATGDDDDSTAGTPGDDDDSTGGDDDATGDDDDATGGTPAGDDDTNSTPSGDDDDPIDTSPNPTPGGDGGDGCTCSTPNTDRPMPAMAMVLLAGSALVMRRRRSR